MKKKKYEKPKITVRKVSSFFLACGTASPCSPIAKEHGSGICAP